MNLTSKSSTRACAQAATENLAEESLSRRRVASRAQRPTSLEKEPASSLRPKWGSEQNLDRDKRRAIAPLETKQQTQKKPGRLVLQLTRRGLLTMAGNDGKIHQTEKKKRSDSSVDSPIKTKQDSNITLDIILKRLNEVHDLAQSTKNTTDAMKLELAAIRADIHTANSKLATLEQRVSDVEDGGAKTSKAILEVTKITTNLQKQLSEQEDKSRRGNIRILGVPEGEEEKAK